MRASKEVAYEAARKPLVFSQFMLASEPAKLILSWMCAHTGVPNGVMFTPCSTQMGVIVHLACGHCRARFSDVAIAYNGMRGIGLANGRFRCPHGQPHVFREVGKILFIDIDACDRCRVAVAHAQLG